MKASKIVTAGRAGMRVGQGLTLGITQVPGQG